MAIYDDDNPTCREIGKLYDDDGTNNYQIGKIYDDDGTTDRLIYSAEENFTLTTSVQQGTSKQWGTATKTISGYKKIKNIVVHPGKSYGTTQTIFAIVRGAVSINNSIKTFYNQDRYYNAEGWWTGSDTVQISDTYDSLQDGDILFFQVGASYNPNLSGSHTSTGSVTFTLE